MTYSSDPEHLFLKWAYKAGGLDADQLQEFNRRSAAERPGEFLLELLLEWDYLTRERMAELLDPDRIRRGVVEGLVSEELARSLAALELPPEDRT